MAVYDLEEQEQLDDLKAWWLQLRQIRRRRARGWSRSSCIGNHRLALVPAGPGRAGERALPGGQPGGRDNDAAKAKEPATQIEDRFGGTAYAPRAALLYAKLLYRRGRPRRRASAAAVGHRSRERGRAQGDRALSPRRIAARRQAVRRRARGARRQDRRGLRRPLRRPARRHPEPPRASPPRRRPRTSSRSPRSMPKSPYRGFVQVKFDALGGAQ